MAPPVACAEIGNALQIRLQGVSNRQQICAFLQNNSETMQLFIHYFMLSWLSCFPVHEMTGSRIKNR